MVALAVWLVSFAVVAYAAVLAVYLAVLVIGGALALVFVPVALLVSTPVLAVAQWRAARRPPRRVARAPHELDIAAIFARPPTTKDQAAARLLAWRPYRAPSAPRP